MGGEPCVGHVTHLTGNSPCARTEITLLFGCLKGAGAAKTGLSDPGPQAPSKREQGAEKYIRLKKKKRRKMSEKRRLDKNQEKAVRHGKGPALVLAGPGSGKTSVITARVLRLIEQDHVPAEKILVITFSRKAAEEMEQRFFRSFQGTKGPCFGTLHSFFFRILKDVYQINNDSLLSEDDKRRILADACRRHLPKGKQEEASDEFLHSLVREISYIKSGAGHIENYVSAVVSPPEFRTLYHAYQKALHELQKIDFDDMILLCRDLLRAREDIRAYWHRRFPFILVDEFQDISPLQYEIVNLLSKPENNLFVVGDDDQSIYAFRGARPDLMKRFLKDHRRATVFTLRMNYRCPPAVLEASQTVIRRNRRRFEKKQASSKAKTFRGTVMVRAYPDPRSQYTEMAQRIRSLLDGGAAPGSIAVLVRNTIHLQLLLDVLDQNQVPVGPVAASVRGKPKKKQNGIFVMTIHAAKGLEFDHVFLPDLNEGILPGSRARKPSEIEEERRIFYVAMTRASHTLFLSYCETRRQRKTAPSRFLEDLLQN